MARLRWCVECAGQWDGRGEGGGEASLREGDRVGGQVSILSDEMMMSILFFFPFSLSSSSLLAWMC